MAGSLIFRLVPTPGNVIAAATFIIGYLYPAWNSFVAIESKTLEDDKQVRDRTCGSLPGVTTLRSADVPAINLACRSLFPPLIPSQWLTYWIVVFTLEVVETVCWPVLEWVPLFKLGRLGLLLWLSHPQFSGATFVYDRAVRPFLLIAAERASAVPAIKPYVNDFLQLEKQKKGGIPTGQSANNGAPLVAESTSKDL
ncbi:hypothetical protein H632_c156p2 [Helicosporidium sp. ATCC 50920]|nr:hypothetical protein H632_c156p2 [Helicosporidium sp. ATCC 50920]|eukprot:KDD76629.1 hypothetical protein H632_c156p2 [Helicosporidium sp. ATCC 50920]